MEKGRTPPDFSMKGKGRGRNHDKGPKVKKPPKDKENTKKSPFPKGFDFDPDEDDDVEFLDVSSSTENLDPSFSGKKEGKKQEKQFFVGEGGSGNYVTVRETFILRKNAF